MKRWKKGTLDNGIACAKLSIEMFYGILGKQQVADEAKIILVDSMAS